MKHRLLLNIIFSMILSVSWFLEKAAAQIVPECDVFIVPDFDSECLITDYLEYNTPVPLVSGMENCLLACKGNTVSYTVSGTAGVQYVWSISGQATCHFTNQNKTAVVTWGDGEIGNITVQVFTADSLVCVAEACILLIESPVAGSASVPFYYLDSENEKSINICLGETIEFMDQSSAGQTPIVGFYWHSEDYGSASSQNYTLTPVQEGDFELTHCVRNECGCEDCEIIHIHVKPEAVLELSCYGTVCSGNTARYSLQSPSCDTYVWHVDGGTLSAGQGTPDIEVHWDSPSSGYGIISLDASLCETECNSLLSVKIPVISDSVKITGPDVVCVGSVQQYELPLWGSTSYTWSISPENYIYERGAEYPNQYLLEFHHPGIYVIHCQYDCPFLDCGTFTVHKTVVVKDTLVISSSDSVLCKGDAGYFGTSHNGSVNWRVLKLPSNQTLYTNVANAIAYTFSSPGNYKVVAFHNDYCKEAEFLVSVKDNPPALTVTEGPYESCPNSFILLTAHPTSPSYYLQWTPLCSSADPHSTEGNEATIYYGNEVCNVAVYQIDKDYGCRSEAYIHEVDTFHLAILDTTSVHHVCAGSIFSISVQDQSDNVTYEWLLSPENGATIINDHLSPSIQIQTNHLYGNPSPYLVTITLKRKYCSGLEKTETRLLSIEDVPFPSLDYPDTVCVGELACFEATTGTLTPSHYTWHFENSPVIHNTTTCRVFTTPGVHHFSLDYLPNPACDAVTINGEIYVVALPYSDIDVDGIQLSVPQQTDVTYSWTLGGVSVGGNTPTLQMADTGTYCCTVTSLISPYCSSSSCYSSTNASGGGPQQQDTCLTVYPYLVSQNCNESTVSILNPPGGNIVWSVSGNSYCYPSVSTQTTVAHCSSPGHPVVNAYIESEGRCYRGSLPLTIDCVPLIEVKYDCGGALVVTDKSKYRQGYSIPVRTVTIDGTNLSGVITYPNMSVTIPTSSLGLGTYTVTMNMNGSSCTVSKSITLEPDPVIHSIDISEKMCEGVPFLFSATASDNAIRFKWDFGDGSYQYGNEIYHTYHNYQNDYHITLTVSNASGCVAVKKDTVRVSAKDLSGQLSAMGSATCPGQNRIISYYPQTLTSHYEWDCDGSTTTTNYNYVYSTGNYTVTVTSDEWGCRVTSRCNVGFRNAPTAAISGNTDFCLGDRVELNGNTGAGHTYSWLITGPETHTGASPIVSIVPHTAGDYSAVLTVTNTEGCSDTATYHFTVHTLPAAPNLSFIGAPCIHNPPVVVQSSSGQPLYWSNGYHGTPALYYSDGFISAYYLDPVTGCPSERRQMFIPPAPNFDALLSGCYEKCPDELPVNLPVYGFYPYYEYVEEFHWYWLLLNSGLVSDGFNTDTLLRISDFGDYELTMHYGDGCVSTSPTLSINKKDICPCDSVVLQLEKSYCFVEDCKMYYYLSYTITNNGSQSVTFDHLNLNAPNTIVNVNTLPLTIPANSSKFIEFTIAFYDFMTSSIEFTLYDSYLNCELQHVEYLSLNRCLNDECKLEELTIKFNSEVSSELNISSFDFSFDIPGAIDLVALWSTPPQIFNYNTSSALTVSGLLMLNYAQLSQLAQSDEGEICFHVVACIDGGTNLCYKKICVSAKELLVMIPEDIRQVLDSITADNDTTRHLLTNTIIPQPGKPWLAPNPARDEVTVMGIAPEEVAEITVLTMQGGQVAEFRNDYRFNVSRLAKASYIVRVITTDRQVHYLKLVKQ